MKHLPCAGWAMWGAPVIRQPAHRLGQQGCGPRSLINEGGVGGAVMQVSAWCVVGRMEPNTFHLPLRILGVSRSKWHLNWGWGFSEVKWEDLEKQWHEQRLDCMISCSEKGPLSRIPWDEAQKETSEGWGWREKLGPIQGPGPKSLRNGCYQFHVTPVGPQPILRGAPRPIGGPHTHNPSLAWRVLSRSVSLIWNKTKVEHSIALALFNGQRMEKWEQITNQLLSSWGD